MQLSKPQQIALHRKYQQSASGHASYLRFRRSVISQFGSGEQGVLVQWGGMWLGIEADGYTHS